MTSFTTLLVLLLGLGDGRAPAASHGPALTAGAEPGAFSKGSSAAAKEPAAKGDRKTRPRPRPRR